MTDTFNRDNSPPHYEADAGGAGHDESPTADVRSGQTPGGHVQCQVREVQRPPAQPDIADDDILPRVDSCCPVAALDNILEELVSPTTSRQTTILPTPAAPDGLPIEAVREDLRNFEQHLPTGITRDMNTDAESLRANLTRLNDHLEWRRR